MFENIGGKIKKLAKICTGIGIVFSVIAGIVTMFQSFFTGLLIAAIGALASWVGSFLLYGFGELVENSQILAGKDLKQKSGEEKSVGTQDVASSNTKTEEPEKPAIDYLAKYKTAKQTTDRRKTCPSCFATVHESDTICANCGNKLN